MSTCKRKLSLPKHTEYWKSCEPKPGAAGNSNNPHELMYYSDKRVRWRSDKPPRYLHISRVTLRLMVSNSTDK